MLWGIVERVWDIVKGAARVVKKVVTWVVDHAPAIAAVVTVVTILTSMPWTWWGGGLAHAAAAGSAVYQVRLDELNLGTKVLEALGDVAWGFLGFVQGIGRGLIAGFPGP